jgi:hypothetical protein
LLCADATSTRLLFGPSPCPGACKAARRIAGAFPNPYEVAAALSEVRVEVAAAYSRLHGLVKDAVSNHGATATAVHALAQSPWGPVLATLLLSIAKRQLDVKRGQCDPLALSARSFASTALAIVSLSGLL